MAEFLHSADTGNAGSYKGCIYAGGNVYFSGIRKDNNIVVGKISAGGTEVVILQPSAISDIHSQPGLVADAQGYIYVCAVDTGEQEPTLYKSATPYGVDFAVLTVVTQPTGRVARYPQMVFDAAGTLWMFVNSSLSTDTRDRDIQYNTSTDNGATWTGWTTLWNAEGMRPYYAMQYVDGEILITTTRTNPFDVVDGTNSGYFLKYANGAWRNSTDIAYTLPVTVATAEMCFDSASAGLNLGFGVQTQKDDLGRYFFIGPAYTGQSADNLYLCREDNGVWTQQDLILGYPSYFGTVISALPTQYKFVAPIEVSNERQIIEFESTDYGATWDATQLTTGQLSAATGRERSSVKKIYGDYSDPKDYFMYADRRWNPTGGNFDWDSDLYSLFATTEGWSMTYTLEWRLVAGPGATTQVTGITDLFYDLSGLTAGTDYESRVLETDGTTPSAFSSWYSFTTASINQDVITVELEQITSAEAVAVDSVSGVTPVPAEQITGAEAVAVSQVEQLPGVVTEHHVNTQLTPVSQVVNVGTTVSEVITEVQPVVVVGTVMPVVAVYSQQVTSVELLSLLDASGINVVVVEQNTGLGNHAVTASSSLSVVTLEQRTNGEVVSSASSLMLSVVNIEQFTDVDMVTILGSVMQVDPRCLRVKRTTVGYNVNRKTIMYTVTLKNTCN